MDTNKTRENEMSRTKLEIFVSVDSEGQYAVSTDRDDVLERHTEDNGIGGSLAIYAITIDVELPGVIEVAATIPAGTKPVAIVTAE
jgi:hypothetical protein